MKIQEKIQAIQDEIGVLKKDSYNPYHESKYFDINQLVNNLKPILTKHNLLLTQPIENGYVCSIIEDVESGEKRVSSIELPKLDNPQKIGSCITYYRRYTLTALLALEAEDDDGNMAAKPTNENPWLNENTTEWDNVVKALSSGNYKIEDVEKKYKISKSNKSKLTNG